MIKRFDVLLLPFPVALVAIMLNGCATKQQNESPPQLLPEKEFLSLKTSKQVADCILEKWQYTPLRNTGALTSSKTRRSYTITQHSSGGIGANPAFVTEIVTIPAGTETLFYVYPPFENDSSDYWHTIQDCQ